MKTINKFIGLIVLSTIIGCAPTVTNTSPNTGATTTMVSPVENTKFVNFVKIAQGMLEIGGKAAIQYAVSDEDKDTIKALLSGSGHVFESLQNGTVPTSDNIKDAISAYFPTSSNKYESVIELSTTAWKYILPIIEQYVPKNNTTLTLAYVNYTLNALSQTAYAVGES